MGKFSAIVCDRCDVRDINQFPPKHDIKPVEISLYIDGNPFASFAIVDLCAACRKGLRDDIIIAITQIPRQA